MKPTPKWDPTIHRIDLDASRSGEWVEVHAVEVDRWWTAVSEYAGRLSRHTSHPVLLVEYGDEGLELAVFTRGEQRADWSCDYQSCEVEPQPQSTDALIEVLGEHHKALSALPKLAANLPYGGAGELLDALGADIDPPGMEDRWRLEGSMDDFRALIAELESGRYLAPDSAASLGT